MNKLLFGTILLALSTVVSNPTLAQVNINVGIALPPLITFEAPPDVIVMPDTNNVYVVPDIDIDLFFWSGWWGVHRKVVGIAHIIITGVGPITTVFQIFILM